MLDYFENTPVSALLLAAAIVVGLIRYVYVKVTPERPYKGFPIVPLPGGVFSGDVIRKGLADHPGRPFQVMGPTGPRIVLPNSYADEIKSHPSLSLSQALVHDFDQDVQGFEALKAAKTTGMKEFDFLVQVVTKLTQSLGLFTPDLADETTHAVDEILGDNSQWHSMTIKKDCLELVARMANRIFLGQDMCRNETWLKLAREHSVEVMMTGRLLNSINPLLRPIQQWFIEPCARLRKARDEAHSIIQPEVNRKAAEIKKAREAGAKVSSKTNSVACMYETARTDKEAVDYSGNTLMLMMVSIHTTTEQLSQTLVNLIANPHVIQPLRDEVAAVIKAEGWSRTALHNMKLMDAFLRESSRLNPLSHVSMNRRVISPMTLSTGEELPVGAIVMVSDNFSDPKIYPDPYKFDPYRYINVPDESRQSSHHVSLTPSNMAFGYGSHACPGRFLASNMMKVVIAMMVVNYDWRVGEGNPEGTKGLWKDMDTKLLVLPDSKVELRARSKEEREVEL